MSEAEQKLPHRMAEVELVVRFLRQRADYWEQYPMHRMTARILRNEAHLIENGHHAKHRGATAA